jgi:hypothetical protein
MNTPGNRLVAAALIVSLTCLFAATPVAAQQAPTAVSMQPGLFRSGDACRQCHDRSPERVAEEIARGNKVIAAGSRLVDFNEGMKWRDHDLHSQAFRVLTLPRAKEIGDALGMKDVTTDARCVSCHSIPADPQTIQTVGGADPQHLIKEGVGCEACHGPSSGYFDAHQLTAFRAVLGKDRLSQHGMVDVRDPVTRTQMCLECHLGKPGTNMVVTHAMYAAGHPPLPSFEIEAFADNMPRHWRYLKEKDKLLPDERQSLATDGDPFPRTRRVLVGGLVALEVSMKLLSHETSKPDASWPALAEFDCGACHHDLKNDSWRQRRGYASLTPGRPLLRSWPQALFDLGLVETAKLESQLQGLQAAARTVPFGNPSSIKSIADEIASAANQQAQQLKSQPLTAASIRGLIGQLSRRGQQSWVDYDAARQIAWAIIMLNKDLVGSDAIADIEPCLADLDRVLHLTRSDKTTVIDPHKTLLDQQAALLKYRAEFDQDRVHGLFHRIDTVVPKN